MIKYFLIAILIALILYAVLMVYAWYYFKGILKEKDMDQIIDWSREI